jgi:hypothetical protein
MGLSENGVQQLMSYHPLQCFFMAGWGIFFPFSATQKISLLGLW